MIVVIDNYDSFVHNLARYIRGLGWPTRILRNDAITLDEVAALAPSHIVISPGPCTPNEAGISVAIVRRFGASTPILGVCLGHQCIAQAYGAKVVRAVRPMHGKASHLRHDGSGIFSGLPNPLRAARYHSLIVSREGLPDVLIPTATSDEGEIMALRHSHHPVVGVQFHPEAVLTDCGQDVLERFLSMAPAVAALASAQ